MGEKLCSLALRGAEEKVLKIDRPFRAGGFLSLTAFQAEGCGIALRAMLIKSALRDFFSVSYNMLPTGQGDGDSHQKGKTPKWYVKYMTRCFSLHISRFPLRGNAT